MGNFGNNPSRKKQPKDSKLNMMPLIEQLQNNIEQTNENLLCKLENLFLREYSMQQKELIYELLRKWKEDPLQDLMTKNIFDESKVKYYREIEILSARVYHRIQQQVKSLEKYQNKRSAQSKYIEYTNTEKLEFSFDRFFWSKRIQRFNSHFNNSPSEKEIVQEKKQKCTLANKAFSRIQSKVLKRSFQFMVFIGLMILEQNKTISNRFMINLERITNQDQKELYLFSMRVPMLEEILKNNGSWHRDDQNKIYKKHLPNYDFYRLNSIKSIRLLHEKYENYQFLQNRHDYIQLMFPNHYGSAFNSQSRPLNYIESRLFATQYMIGVKMLKSVVIFFDFLGLELNLETQSLLIIDEKRLKDALLVNTHNHLRIMRILACLSVIGFRRIALLLIDFLDQNTREKQILSKFRYKFEKNWKIYGNQNCKDEGKSMCFLQEQRYPSEHVVFKEIGSIYEKINSKSAKKIGQQHVVEIQEEKIQQEDVGDKVSQPFE